MKIFFKAHMGKLTGFLLGLVLGNVGWALACLLPGALLDRRLALERCLGLAWRGCGMSRRDQFFHGALFVTAGHLAKADGRVSPAEIRAAEALMAELGLKGERRRRAIALFNAGKAGRGPWRRLLRRFARAADRRMERRERLLGYLLRVAFADGAPVPAADRVLGEVANRLDISRMRMDDLRRRRRHHQERERHQSRSVRPTLNGAYRLLDVPETADEAAIRRAYRRAVSRHHPDRAQARGLGEQAVREATRRTHEIRQAYEEIRRVRGF
ncbi:co-chaperone DjlA [Alkalilimnicola sp. S0819]|uniref:co-chaperone DjlA n=1 Tax=Alkalilimnicola sp. S0819 TaxID=2613922 RepID=UPI001869E9AB|nr:co-chaperone DjlA [Alkalilimnicola sp. S0819]